MKLKSVISTVFCGIHDLPIYGKKDFVPVSSGFLNFRVETLDNILNEHFWTCARNSKYTSHQAQKDIECCQNVLKHDLANKMTDCSFLFFSVLSREMSDILRTEHLSIGKRFILKSADNEEKFINRDEFNGFLFYL